MDTATRRQLIDRYKEGYLVVARELEGITEEQLDASPGPGKWTAREIVHHLADSEMESALRLRRLVALERPVLQGYDQDEFARNLFYRDRPYELSLEAFRLARLTTATILERMGSGDWAKEGQHTESGRFTVEQWLEYYANHAHTHAEQIRRARRGGSL